MSNHCN